MKINLQTLKEIIGNKITITDWERIEKITGEQEHSEKELFVNKVTDSLSSVNEFIECIDRIILAHDKALKTNTVNGTEQFNRYEDFKLALINLHDKYLKG